MRKAPKLIAKTLNPGDNKQDVQRALNIFYATTCTAIEEYFSAGKRLSEFLNLFQSWWTISNSKSKFSNIRLGNGARIGDGKPEF